MKEESEKADLKLNIQRMMIMAPSPITLWQIDEKKNGNSGRFIFLGSKITMDSDCSHEIKGHLLLGRKAMTNLDSILKKQKLLCHHFANKGPYSQSYGFSSSHLQMWELDHKEGWVPKNWCFWTVVLEKTLESSLDSKRIKPVNPKGNQSVQFSCSLVSDSLQLHGLQHATPPYPSPTLGVYSNSCPLPEYLLEGLMLKLQYFGHLMWRANLLEKTLMLGKTEGRKKKGDNTGWHGWMALLTQWTWVWANSRR